MEIKVKNDNFANRVEKLIASGVPASKARNAILEIDQDVRRNPRKYLQPFIKAPNGEMIENKEFHDIYGHPDKPYQNAGKGDWKDKLENDKMEQDRLNFLRGKYKSYGVS